MFQIGWRWGVAKLRKSWLTWTGRAAAAAALGWGMAPAAVAQPGATDGDAAEVEALPSAPASAAAAAPKVAPMGVAPMPAVPTIYETGRVGLIELSDSRSD